MDKMECHLDWSELVYQMLLLLYILFPILAWSTLFVVGLLGTVELWVLLRVYRCVEVILGFY